MADREEELQAPPGEEIEERVDLFPIKGYVWLNVFFWVFCAAEVGLIYIWLRDIRGVIFFFLLLAIGFTLVSIYDCVYDRLTARSRAAAKEEPSEPADNTAS